jgi:phage I-like protein
VKTKFIDVTASELTDVLALAAPSVIEMPSDPKGPLPSAIVWMPAGDHEINASTINGEGYVGRAICDEQAARSIAASFAKLTAGGQRVWLDFNHADAEASAWVKGFYWDAGKGIMASVDWTPGGEAALRNRSYYSFSPTFRVDRSSGRVVSLVPDHAAGGLVNAPAFGSAMPALIAARSGGNTNKPASGGSPENHQIMKDIIAKMLAALKITVPADATEEQVLALYAKHSADIVTAVAAEREEVKALKAEFASVQAKADAAVAKAKKDADEAEVQAAKLQAKKDADALKAELAEVKAALVALRANAGPGIVEVTAESVTDVIRGYAIEPDVTKRGSHFRDNIAKVIAKIGGRGFSIALRDSFPALRRNADVQAANSLGTLVGNLIAQQSLSLLKYEFPLLKNISADFSNQSADFNQTIITRLKSAIAASQYSGSGYTAASATLTDVPVTLSHHPYAQVSFNANELASTNRDLFGEQAEVVNYAIGLDIINAIYALLIAANYPTTPLTVTGTTGASYNRAAAVAAAQQLFINKVPRANRFNLLNAIAFGGLAQDSSIVSLAAFQKPEIITGYELPPIADMQPIQAVNLPTTGSMVAFAGHPRALAIATRVPNDYTQALPGSNYGAVSQVTDPDTGITVMVTQYVNHDAGTSNYRVALMYGVAVGDPNAGVITTHS